LQALENDVTGSKEIEEDIANSLAVEKSNKPNTNNKAE